MAVSAVILVFNLLCYSSLAVADRNVADTSVADQIVADPIDRQREFDNLKAQVGELFKYRNHDVLTTELLVAERRADRKQIEELTSLVRDIQNRFDEHIDTKTKYEEEISELKETIGELKEIKVKHEHEIKDLKDTVVELHISTAEDRRIIQELQNQIDNVEFTPSDSPDNNDDANVERKVEADNKTLHDSDKKAKNDKTRPRGKNTNAKKGVSQPRASRIEKRLDPPQAGVSSFPAFTACVSSSSDISLGANQHVVFDRIVTNNGGYYHSTTGIFTAPLEGVYVFHLSLMTSARKDLYLRITKDGKGLDTVYSDAREDSSYDSVAETWVLNLQEGSEVWMAAVYPGDIHGNCHSQFTGFLLHAGGITNTDVLG